MMSSNMDKLRAEQARIHEERKQKRRKMAMIRDTAGLVLAVLSFGVLLGTAGGLEHGRIGMLAATIVMAAAMAGLWVASECMR